ncbi:hypothetical protein TPB0596_00020 [Tsukamurella pulmonis]|uniref:hypothetical protein n=1 Tax=Tsukamurella pulmonis TaxID=47312 RepID=UPI001EDED3AE|nr:hypothetical protein [Tsukamurella pulmonis]BDD80239.1 hypothetical protein TPB0596_00020 [Tsukamurella pulmonis]
MGYPDPQRPGEHPGGQNYPAGPQGPNVPKPTREYERPDAGPADPGASQGPPAPPPPPPAGPGGPGAPGPQDPPTQQYDGGYQLGYAPGAYGDQYGAPPPQGPPPGPGGPWGPGDGGDGSGGGNGGNKKLLWIAAAAVVFALVLAVIVALVATSGGPSSSTASETTTTTAPPTTTTSGKPGGITLPGEIPSGISIPPIFGGESTGPNARKWRVEVTGSGSAQLVTVGIPETNLFGSQPLPWSKEFTSDSFLVTVTVIGYTGDASCTITRDGTTVAEERSTGGSAGPLICTASR